MRLTTDNVQYASTDALISEIKALQKEQVSESTIQVLFDILEQKKLYYLNVLQELKVLFTFDFVSEHVKDCVNFAEKEVKKIDDFFDKNF